MSDNTDPAKLPEQLTPEEPQGPSKSQLKKQARDQKKEQKKSEKSARRAEQAAQKDATEVTLNEFYGPLPLNQSQSRPRLPRSDIVSLPSKIGETVLVRARVQTSRAQGSKMVFFTLRQRTDTIQALLIVTPEKVTKEMTKWAAAIASESIVLVEGVVEKTPEPVKTATVNDVEIHVSRIHLICGVEGIGEDHVLPFNIEDASRPAKDLEDPDSQFKSINLDTRLNNRILDLRTPVNHAIFKIQAAVGDMFRNHLHSEHFIEIHSPKLQGSATESGSSVFEVSYFKGKAFLAQSPQLAKQMAIAADFERVYEIGPVFRAENSFTHRHLTEFMGLDLEMAIDEHYHEVLELLDSMFLHIFRGLRENYRKEIEQIREQFPCEEFIWREGPEGTLKISFKEAVDLLVEDGVPREELDDINTENEKRLGRIIRAKYQTDYFIIDKFPMNLRPFYTMPDPVDPTLSNSYDFFMRGEEILSGAQRIHDPNVLAEKMREKDVDPNSMQGYLDAFRLGCPPHGGGGIGLERVVMLFLKLGNIRRATLFPRDPKRLEP